MEMTYDLIDCFDNEISLLIMELLSAVDVLNAAAVSRSWRRFVIANGLCKKAFSRLFALPHVAQITYEIEGSSETIKLPDALTVDGGDWGALEKDHKLYSSLIQPLATPYLPRDCISYPVGVSSTLNTYGIYDDILCTMNPVDEFEGGHSFWSSEGQVDPDVPEYITYKLCSNMCIVTEVNIRPYKASSEPENPVYAPKSVRFRFGYSRTLDELEITLIPFQRATFDEYIWTYTSPEFPMTQEAGLQRFKFPEPIVCIGGVVQIEMMGRAQMDPNDGLFYIRLGYVEILGQSIHPPYVLDTLQNGELHLKFCPHILDCVMRSFCHNSEYLAHMAFL